MGAKGRDEATDGGSRCRDSFDGKASPGPRSRSRCLVSSARGGIYRARWLGLGHTGASRPHAELRDKSLVRDPRHRTATRLAQASPAERGDSDLPARDPGHRGEHVPRESTRPQADRRRPALDRGYGNRRARPLGPPAASPTLASLGASRRQQRQRNQAPIGARRPITALPGRCRGTAYGLFNAATGVAALPASVLAGLLWDWYGAPAPFLAGGALALVAAVGMVAIVPRSSR